MALLIQLISLTLQKSDKICVIRKIFPLTAQVLQHTFICGTHQLTQRSSWIYDNSGCCSRVLAWGPPISHNRNIPDSPHFSWDFKNQWEWVGLTCTQELSHLQHMESTPIPSWMDKRVWDFTRHILASQRHTESSSLTAHLTALKFQLIPRIHWIPYQFYSQYPDSSNINETGSYSLKKFTKLTANETLCLWHHCHRRLISDIQLLSLHSGVPPLVEEKLLLVTKRRKMYLFYQRGFLFSLLQKECDSWERTEQSDLIIKSLRSCNAAFRCMYLKTFKLLWGRKTSDS